MMALDADAMSKEASIFFHEALTVIGTDPFVSPIVKNRVLKKKLEIIQQGNVLHENQEWDTYEFLLGNYAMQKDYDNYLKTVNKMIERFASSSRKNELIEYKRQAEAASEMQAGKSPDKQ